MIRVRFPGSWRGWNRFEIAAVSCLFGIILCIVILNTGSKPSAVIFRAFNYPKACGPEKRHVILLRVPKTGTSTTTFLIWRYALRQNLTVLLPKPGQEETYASISNRFHELFVSIYDVMANQLIYNPVNFGQYFYEDTKVVALVRHPLQHFISSIHYVQSEYIRAVIPGENKVAKYLQNPWQYERMLGNPYISLTNNPLAVFFGLENRKLRHRLAINEFISRIDTQFHVVMIIERLDESLIMLKRTLCWSIRDIIYRVENVNKAKPEEHVSPEDSLRHRAWAMADYAIYDHFSEKLDNYTNQNGQGFLQEVAAFKHLLKTVWEFCDNLNNYEENAVFLQGTAFYDAFHYSAFECKMLKFSGLHLRNLIRQRQNTPLE